ncbi:MAG: GFA family protein [Thermomonas sp.]|uniref:GFA family protein n=1 Tax=Thermomonas sp. TaxID=1971895 RepID=UPI0039E4E957
MDATPFPVEGGCSCGAARYRMLAAPIVVHACHCSWCQRETGSAFVLNAMVERDRLQLLVDPAALELVATPSASGKGQRIIRCGTCKVALWSHYPGGGSAIAFVRVGTLDTPNAAPPDIHIYTSTKQAWLQLPPDARAFAEFYDPQREWSAQSRERYRAAKVAAAAARD